MRQCKPELSDVACQLKIVDGEITLWVGGGDKLPGFLFGPRVAPEVGGATGPCKDAAHSLPGGVVGASPGRKFGQDLLDVCQLCCERAEEHPPVVEFVVDLGGQSDAALGAFQWQVEA